MRLGGDVAVADVHREIVESVLGLTGVRAAHPSAHNTEHKADQEQRNHLRRAGGAPCPDLYETRPCYGTTPVNCQLSSWSEWSACTTPCGVLGTQSSSRHRITTEQCGGSCTSTFRKTRACPDLSCLNGGSLKDDTCFCKEGYSGKCCQKGKRAIPKYHSPC